MKAALLPKEQLEQEPVALQDLLRNIKDGLDENCLNLMHDSRTKDREAVTSNVVRQVEGLTRDRSIMYNVEQGELIISAAFNEISSGIVDFLSTLDKAAPSSKNASKATVPIEGKVDVSLGKQPAVFNNNNPVAGEGPPPRTPGGGQDQVIWRRAQARISAVRRAMRSCGSVSVGRRSSLGWLVVSVSHCSSGGLGELCSFVSVQSSVFVGALFSPRALFS